MKTKPNSRVITNLWFSIKQVFLSSPILFVISMLISITNKIISFVMMYIAKLTIDELQYIYLGQDSPESIIKYIIFTVSLTICLAFFGWIDSVVNAKQSYKFQIYVDETFINKNATLDIAIFDNPKFYNILEEAERSKRALNFVVSRVIHFTSYIISLVISLSIAFSYQNMLLPFVIIAFVIPALFNKGRYYTKVYQYDIDKRTQMRKMSYDAKILLDKTAAKELRFYNIKEYILKKYDAGLSEYIKGKKKIIHTHGLINSFFNVLPTVGVFIAVLIVTNNILAGEGKIGDFVYYMGIFVTLKENLLGMVEDISKLKESEYAIQKYQDYMNIKPLLHTMGTKSIEKIETIELKDVCFTYPKTDAPIFDKLNLKIVIPQKIAIVGMNGAGKTTIIKLLLRFYDVDSGEILINGVNIKEFEVNSLRKLIAPAFQTPILYSLSLRLNVSLSDMSQKGDDARIIEKLKMFGLDDLANESELEKDISRDFCEDGIMLSGGQRQKLALARFAFPDADLYIMDEPTASLDPISEHDILCEFKKLYADKGMIMVSHRLSNVVDMDCIFVFKDGRCVEQGNHNTLYKMQGLYYEMFTRQSFNYTTSE